MTRPTDPTFASVRRPGASTARRFAAAVPAVAACLLVPLSASLLAPEAQAAPRLVPQEVHFKTAMKPDRELVGFLYTPRPAESVTADGATPPGPGPVTPPGTGPAAPPASNPFGPAPVLFFSGEWGWRPLLQDTASTIAAEGRAVLGIESNEYFSRIIDNQGLANDLKMFRARLNEAVGRAPDAPVVIAGFAYGAEMVPYLLNRAGPVGLNGLLLIAPDMEGATIYRVAIQLRMPSPPNEQFSVAQEMSRLPRLPVVLMQGTLDEHATARELAAFLRGPHLYVPIEGGDRQFREARAPFFSQVLAAFRWFDQGAPPLPGAPPATGPR
jgi:hypothetical protein